MSSQVLAQQMRAQAEHRANVLWGKVSNGIIIILLFGILIK